METMYHVDVLNGDKLISSFYFYRKKEAISKFNELIESSYVWNTVKIYQVKLLDECTQLCIEPEDSLCVL